MKCVSVCTLAQSEGDFVRTLDERFTQMSDLQQNYSEFFLLDAVNVREWFMEQAEEEYFQFLAYFAAYMTQCPLNLS